MTYVEEIIWGNDSALASLKEASNILKDFAKEMAEMNEGMQEALEAAE